MAKGPSVVWSRRDFRLADNPALAEAAAGGSPVLVVFIHEPAGAWADGAAAAWWLRRSLTAFRRQIEGIGGTLVERQGEPTAVLLDLARETGADTVLWNDRYAPVARAADDRTAEALSAAGLRVRCCAGNLMFAPEAVQTPSGQPYQLFGAFWKACLNRAEPTLPLPAPTRLEALPQPPADDPPPLMPEPPDAAGWAAAWPQAESGEAAAIARLQAFVDAPLSRYGITRDLPDQAGTSMLSPYLAFGEVSPRQIWHSARLASALGGDAFLRELGWREFCWHTLAHFPDLPDLPLKRPFADFPWLPDDGRFAAWTTGRTGYPIVDAGMRALMATGWMHNRVRMIVASFLVKDLLIPWQQGEAWFWDRLVDADLACNAGNWQWVAGCGLDAAPYFRIFNPVLQAEKFDARGRFVRQWLPELARLPDMFIHRPATAPADVLARAGVRLGETYPYPLVEHGMARRRAMVAYEQMRGSERFPLAARQG